MEEERYKHLNKYLKEKYGERVLKICIDGNFSCPNRDGTCGKGGCIFCSEKGSGDHLHKWTIQQQINSFLNSYRGKRANKFIAYFQNFTNTYADVQTLKEKYDEALKSSSKIIALSVATRPDCINEDVVKLLASYMGEYDVYVELGLQTADEKIASYINRGYKNNVFTKAVGLLNSYKIPVIVHIMVGLPFEDDKTIMKNIDFINSHNIQGIKIHSTYVVKNTVLYQKYINNEYIPLTIDDYIEKACFYLTHISPEIVIHRISGDAPKESLIAPDWNAHKKWIMNGIDKYLKEKDYKQGMFYKGKLNK